MAKDYFIAKISALSIVPPASSDFWKAPLQSIVFSALRTTCDRLFQFKTFLNIRVSDFFLRGGGGWWDGRERERGCQAVQCLLILTIGKQNKLFKPVLMKLSKSQSNHRLRQFSNGCYRKPLVRLLSRNCIYLFISLQIPQNVLPAYFLSFVSIKYS